MNFVVIRALGLEIQTNPEQEDLVRDSRYSLEEDLELNFPEQAILAQTGLAQMGLAQEGLAQEGLVQVDLTRTVLIHIED